MTEVVCIGEYNSTAALNIWFTQKLENILLLLYYANIQYPQYTLLKY